MKLKIEYKYLICSLMLSTFSLFTSCKTNQLAKEEAKAKNLKVIDSLYNQSEYKIDVNVAYPFATMATTRVADALLRNTGNNVNRIDVNGDGNFIEIKNDSIKAYLPFFGESRISAGNYGGTDLAIQIDEPLDDLSKEKNVEKQKLELKFKAEQKGTDNEKYDVRIEIYPNKSVMINITPVYRTFMRYDGVLKKFEEEEK